MQMTPTRTVFTNSTLFVTVASESHQGDQGRSPGYLIATFHAFQSLGNYLAHQMFKSGGESQYHQLPESKASGLDREVMLASSANSIFAVP